MSTRIPATSLIAFASALLQKTGLEADKAAVVSRILVEGDLLGHSTHGLHLLPLYLDELAHDRMAKSGEPKVLADFPAAVTWDGLHLPGPWLTVRALALAANRAKTNGSCSVAIRRSHHIACLAAYLREPAEDGLLVLLTCSDPRMGAVAPHGGRSGLYTPNPIAAAWPTADGTVILDTSTSIASYGVARRHFDEGRKLPGPWLLDAQGYPTDDPAVLFAKPPGSMLPIGGADHGYKGFALGLLVEALTGGLAGWGRADPSEGWTNDVFLQVLCPARFAGADSFSRQTSWLASACRKTPPRPGFEPVRLPGDAGRLRREEQLKHGVDLHPKIMPALAPWARRLGVDLPAAVTA